MSGPGRCRGVLPALQLEVIVRTLFFHTYTISSRLKFELF